MTEDKNVQYTISGCLMNILNQMQSRTSTNCCLGNIYPIYGFS